MIFNLMDNVRRASGLELAYTGTMTQSNITVSGALYTLYTLTTSGTLTVTGNGTADIWCCGGGSGGKFTYSYIRGFDGGAGAYCANLTAKNLKGAYTVTIGTGGAGGSTGGAGSATSIMQGETSILTANGASGKNGGTGGGAGNYTTADLKPVPTVGGTGDGVTKYPFSDSTNFFCHCAGGGGGAAYGSSNAAMGYHTDGGAGGTNGGNGSANKVSTDTDSQPGGAGGNRGGGAGGLVVWHSTAAGGGSATFYGSGGGGGGLRITDDSARGTAGAGYQGVMYIRVPQASTPGGTAYKYYRLNMTGMMRGSTASTYFSVAELALYNGSTAVSYTGATYSASSSLSGYAVGNAFDGSTSTIWHTDGAPESAWIQVQLASASKITSFAITPRTDQNDRLNAFTLQGSNDGSTWTTLYTGTNTASGWAQGATKTFTI